MRSAKRTPQSRAHALDLLRALVSGLTASARAVERRTGITNAQVFLLQALAHDGPLAIGDLALRAKTQPSTVSIVVARLARAGLVAKAQSADDRRRTVVSVTAAGRRLIRMAPVPPTARLMHAIDGMTEHEVRVLSNGLESLVAGLSFDAVDPPLLFEDRPHAVRRRGT